MRNPAEHCAFRTLSHPGNNLNSANLPITSSGYGVQGFRANSTGGFFTQTLFPLLCFTFRLKRVRARYEITAVYIKYIALHRRPNAQTASPHTPRPSVYPTDANSNSEVLQKTDVDQ